MTNRATDSFFPTAMFGIRLLCCFASIIGSAWTVSPPPGLMQSKLQPFVDSLALPPPQAHSLSSQLTRDANLAAFLSGKDYQSSLVLVVACLSIRASLGAESVDTIPINQTETEANWFADIGLTYHQNTEYMFTGHRAVGGPQHASLFQNQHKT